MYSYFPAIESLKKALELMEYEMNHPEDTLSLAMYEYSESVDANRMEYFNQIGEEKWSTLIEYGMKQGE